MKVRIFLLFFSIQFLIPFLSEASMGEEWGEVVDFSSIPPARRVAALASQCVEMYQKKGCVGINLEAFKDPVLGKAFLFPTKTPDLSCLRQFLIEREPQPLGSENVFLCFSSTKRHKVFVGIYVESNYHHINDMQATFRGEAKCYRQVLYEVVDVDDVPIFLYGKKNASVLADPAYAIYYRFLTRSSDDFKNFLSLFVGKMSNTDISKLTLPQPAFL